MLGFGDVYRYVGGKLDWLASGLPREGQETDRPRAGDLARHAVPTCLPTETIKRVRERVQDAGWDVCVVVNEQRVVLGRLGPEAWAASDLALAEDVMDPGPSTFRPNVSADEMARYMRENDLHQALISTPDGVLLGLLFREDIEVVGDGAAVTENGRAAYVQGR
jgi:CBS domain-containing protein